MHLLISIRFRRKIGVSLSSLKGQQLITNANLPVYTHVFDIHNRSSDFHQSLSLID